ncbi:MAG: VTT domain-containing protein [Gemmatimonadetes bacterium]|nr:VTT domain-containing protein [Gemmatimonadota bacterium]
MAEWIRVFGVWAVLAGGIVEGEAVFIAAGYAVSQGYLSGGAALVAGALGATLGDHGWYLAGRIWGERLIRRVPALQRLRGRVAAWLERWGRGAAFGLRFAYGMRSVLPLSLGAARFPPALFVPANLLGAVVFAATYLSLGYFFGEAAERVFQRVAASAPRVAGAIVVVGMIAWGAREWWLFHDRKQQDGDPPS